MNHFDLAQSFIARCGSGAKTEDLAAAFGQTTETLGFRYFACCSHVDLLKPPRRAIALHSYPEAWVRACSELKFWDIDPVFQHANRTLSPFFWDAARFRKDLTLSQLEILAEATRYGIAHGYTVPLHSPWSSPAYQASCSVVPDSAVLDNSCYFTVHLIAYYLYEAAIGEADAKAGVSPHSLARRERECLELAAQGKSNWVMGKILGISEWTVHNHIKSAKRRLGVATRVQAIVHALFGRQISFGDVIKSERFDPGEIKTHTRTDDD